MKDTIKTVSLGIIAVLVLVWTGYFVALKYFGLQSQINQITNFLNSQIQRNQTPAPTK